jgi:hypothetical protein
MFVFVTLHESTETVRRQIYKTLLSFNKLSLICLFLKLKFFMMTCRLDIEGLVPSHAAHLVLGILSENVPNKITIAEQ